LTAIRDFVLLTKVFLTGREGRKEGRKIITNKRKDGRKIITEGRL
jgi:hypothetical protein